MSDVEVFYDELRESTYELTDAAFSLQTDASNLASGDTGVDDPVGRHSLAAALDRQIDAVREATLAHREAGEALRTTLTNITDRYSDLDLELRGDDQS